MNITLPDVLALIALVCVALDVVTARSASLLHLAVGLTAAAVLLA